MPENETYKTTINDNINTKCSDTSILFSGIGGFTLAAKQLGGIQTTQFVEINLDAQSVLRSHFPGVPIHSDIRDYQPRAGEFDLITMGFPCTGTSVTQELERDSSTQHHLFGEKDLDVLSRLNPASVLSNNLKELSDEDFELFLGDSLWQDTLGKLKQSRRESLGRVIKGSDYLSFPTLTSNVSLRADLLVRPNARNGSKTTG